MNDPQNEVTNKYEIYKTIFISFETLKKATQSKINSVVGECLDKYFESPKYAIKGSLGGIIIHIFEVSITTDGVNLDLSWYIDNSIESAEEEIIEFLTDEL